MAINTGLSYEVITQVIFQEILNQDSMKLIQVGGVQYQTVVQAKDWNKAVDQGEILKFHSVLADLPGQPRGIFVTRTGYQSGAEEFARANGILLYELKVVPDEPPIVLTLLSYARISACYYHDQIVFEVSVYNPEFSNVVLRVDKTWFDDKVTKKTLHANLSDTTLYDESGNQTQILRDVFKKLVMKMRDQGLSEHNATIDFEQPTFLKPSGELPFCKVLGISARIEIRETVQQTRGRTNFVEWMLKNLQDGTFTHYVLQ